ncbi:D-serine dehydratase [Bacillus ectoiniformans]|uniref:D-serine ammonia-lyase n=1 Tax=Bacillus ectoiniformans TaxID=1494429 RepID=UPI00195D1526|nr:D-serine ammonia-lyase [Bacillus ectoiniformans]MBM7648681.1 D-serine dehydratase [Bacillus ectoiniformans]
MQTIIAGKTKADWLEEIPLLKRIVGLEEVFWTNPSLVTFAQAIEKAPLSMDDVLDAEARWQRFAPFFMKAFPETVPSKGLIESPVKEIPDMKIKMKQLGESIEGNWLIKCDSHLPISGSIKARGGIYEVLKYAETLAMEQGLLTKEDNYAKLDEESFREFFSNYSIVVGSTGNLGLSIGIMGAALGFQVVVHMSLDAKEWKKNLLREKGVRVVEHASDYSLAVEEGRREAELDPRAYFIDDENSKDLFLGYAVAALRLKEQLQQQEVTVDANHPLYVYLPCGVGGGPGGVAFGLKLVFGDHVHCFFAEPTHSPCMLIGLLTGKHDQVSVQDFGIDNRTDADGLAVGRPSGFVGQLMEPFLSGSYTVSDETMYVLLSLLKEVEGLELEPSALAGVAGPLHLPKELATRNATHLSWATGGNMVPEEMKAIYEEKGKSIRMLGGEFRE